MRKTPYLVLPALVLAIVVFSASAFAEAVYHCPAGPGAKRGDLPKVSYWVTDTRGVFVCGNQQKLLPGGWARMDSFSVYSMGFGGQKPKFFFKAGPAESYRIFAGVDAGVVFERVVSIPLMKNSDPTEVVISKIAMKCSKRGCSRTASQCALSQMPKEPFPEVMKMIKENPNALESSSKLLARALSGDAEAATALEKLDEASVAQSNAALAQIVSEHKLALKAAQEARCF